MENKENYVSMAYDNSGYPIPCIALGPSRDVSDIRVTPLSNVIRICAIAECRVKGSGDKDSVGVLIPKGCVEYFSMRGCKEIIIEGTANLMNVR